MKRKIVVGVSGASGSIYAKVLFDRLKSEELKAQYAKIGVVFSKNAKDIWKFELNNDYFNQIPFEVFDTHDFNAPFASGSANFETLIICPCSMGTIGRIASGVSDDLLTRTADVMLKERRKLIVVPRETPFSIIHLHNMLHISQAGAIVCPAIPSFYSKPQTMEEIASTVIDRVLQLAGFEINTFRWSESE